MTAASTWHSPSQMLANGNARVNFPKAKLPAPCGVFLERLCACRCRWQSSTGRGVCPPPARLRAAPSRRLPLKGGVMLRCGFRSYADHSPLEGESQKPSRQAKADAVGGSSRPAEKTLDASFYPLLRFRHWSQGARKRAKREAGGIPARSRHCDQRARRRSRPLLLHAMGRQPVERLSCQSGDLPWD